MTLISIFASTILPIVAIAGTGFLLGTRRDVQADSLNTITLYILIPALVFHSLATTELSGTTLLGIASGVFIFVGAMTLLAEGTGRALGEQTPILGSFVLVSVFANSGNYGIPVSEFAFGAVGRSTAVIYVAAQMIAMYTLGVYVAARGESDDWKENVRTIFTVPLVYAVVAGLAARWFGLLPPAGSPTMETLKLVGDSAIPVMLLILGIELSDIEYGMSMLRVSPAAVLKLLIAPLLAIAIAKGIGFQNSTVARVFILECAMPAAVTTLILTGEFAKPGHGDIDATSYASTTIFITTILSIPILTLLIAVLQSGIII